MLRMILALAVEYGHMPSNPAVGRRRHLKVTRPRCPVPMSCLSRAGCRLYPMGDAAQAEAHLRLNPGRARPGPRLGDGLARSHRPAIYVAHVHAPHAARER